MVATMMGTSLIGGKRKWAKASDDVYCVDDQEV
jgi:hypothetical protein